MPTEKQINQLPDANRYLSSTDFLAFEDANNVTYKISGDRLGISPYAATITSGQWSGSGSDYYITVSASNVTADSILIPHYDNASLQYMQGPVWCVPAAGSFTIHTSALPTGTVTILVQFVGVMGEAQYQVLADVYSTSQAVAKADIVNNLTRDATKVTSAQCVYDAMKSYDELCDFSGVSSQTVNLDGTASNYCFLTFIVYDSDGQIVNAVTAPPVYFRNLTAKIYGDTNSTWGSVKVSSDYTQATFNRTSATTTKVRLLGCMKLV